MTVRRVYAEDARALWEMNREFNGPDVASVGRVAHCLSGGAPAETVFIALENGEPAGFLCGRICTSFCYEDESAELTEMFVREAHRRKGAGTALVRAFLAWCADSAIGEIRLLTGRDNASARAFYESLGFRPTDEMEYRLPPSERDAR